MVTARDMAALDPRLTVPYAFVPKEEKGMKHTRLVIRLTGLCEAQAEGVVAILALVLLALGAALMVHWR